MLAAILALTLREMHAIFVLRSSAYMIRAAIGAQIFVGCGFLPPQQVVRALNYFTLFIEIEDHSRSKNLPSPLDDILFLENGSKLLTLVTFSHTCGHRSARHEAITLKCWFLFRVKTNRFHCIVVSLFRRKKFADKMWAISSRMVCRARMIFWHIQSSIIPSRRFCT